MSRDAFFKLAGHMDGVARCVCGSASDKPCALWVSTAGPSISIRHGQRELKSWQLSSLIGVDPKKEDFCPVLSRWRVSIEEGKLAALKWLAAHGQWPIVGRTRFMADHGPFTCATIEHTHQAAAAMLESGLYDETVYLNEEIVRETQNVIEDCERAQLRELLAKYPTEAGQS